MVPVLCREALLAPVRRVREVDTPTTGRHQVRTMRFRTHWNPFSGLKGPEVEAQTVYLYVYHRGRSPTLLTSSFTDNDGHHKENRLIVVPTGTRDRDGSGHPTPVRRRRGGETSRLNSPTSRSGRVTDGPSRVPFVSQVGEGRRVKERLESRRSHEKFEFLVH